MYLILSSYALFSALATRTFVDDDGTKYAMSFDKFTRFGAYVENDQVFAVVSMDKSAGPINTTNVPDLPGNVQVTEMFGAISFGKLNQFILGLNDNGTSKIRHFFMEALETGYTFDDNYVAGSTLLLSVEDGDRKPVYLFIDDAEVTDVAAKIDGVEIVTIDDDRRVTEFAIRKHQNGGMRVIMATTDELIGYLTNKDQELNIYDLPVNTISMKSLLTQAPNGKVAITDFEAGRLTIYDRKGISLNTVDLPDDVVLVKVAIGDNGEINDGFVSYVKREQGKFMVETAAVNEVLGESAAYGWTGSPKPGPENGQAAPSK